MQVTDSLGNRYRLGDALGQGGEGVVYRVHGQPDQAAKLYHQPPPTELAAKLGAMAAMATDDLRAVATWPLRVLLDGRGVASVGYLMPLAAGYEPIHQLYTPKSRRQRFPQADWGFLLRVAKNFAAAMARVHDHGVIIGDVNLGNVLVAGAAGVRLIDTDSFHIETGGARYPCRVGFDEYLAPEAQRDLQRVGKHEYLARTPGHDAFSLAVIVFQLLFMGRHPFAGRQLDGGEAEWSALIMAQRYAYGPSAAARRMAPPPGALDLSLTPPSTQALFERAFTGPPARRPTAEDWAEELGRVLAALTQCRIEPAHRYHPASGRCLWCEADARRTTPFFAQASALETLETIEHRSAAERQRQAVETAARRMPPPPARPRTAAPAPSAAPRFAPIKLHLPPVADDALQALLARVRALKKQGPKPAFGPVAEIPTLDGSLSELAARFQVPLHAPPDRLQRLLAEIDQRIASEAAQWRGLLGGFYAAAAEAEDLVQQCRALPDAFDREVAALNGVDPPEHLHRWLELHRIGDAHLPELRGGIDALLESFDLETAADLTTEALDGVSGLGARRRDALLAWRRKIETGIDPTQAGLAIAKRLRQTYGHRLRGMHDRLTQIPAEMERLQKKFNGLRPMLQRASNNLAQRRVIALAALDRQEGGP
jgi:DNA-binding helix-hairpin-helix protein with protein kinase domain